MADKELLSSQEIDALLAGGVETHDEEAGGTTAAAGARPYRLGREPEQARGRLPTLEIIAERFARHLSRSLRDMFRTPVVVSSGSVDTQTFASYCKTTAVPVSLSVCAFAPLPGFGLVEMQASLIRQLLDRYFGGSGAATEGPHSQFTPTECRIIDRVRERLFADWDSAWKDIVPISSALVSEDSNPNLLNAFAAEDLLTCVSFMVSADPIQGRLVIAVPYKALEQHRRVLDTPGKASADSQATDWRPRIQRALLDTEVSLRCQIATAELRLADLLELKSGDIIQADVPELHTAYAEDVPLFRAKLGESAGKLALEMKSTC